MQANFISRILFGLFLLILPLKISYSQPDPANYHLIYGNRDGSPKQVVIGSRIEIPAWGATEPNNWIDTVAYMYMPLASNDSIITQRLGGFFPDTLVGLWDDRSFWPADIDPLYHGWTNQSMEAFASVAEPRDPWKFFWTNGDTIILCTYLIEVPFDTTLAGQVVDPFMEGWNHRADYGLLWGFADGISEVIPTATYPVLQFLSSSEVGSIHGRVTNEYSNPLIGVSVSAEGTLRADTTDSDGRYILDWLMPDSYSLSFAMIGYFDTTLINIETTAGDTSIADVTLNFSGSLDPANYHLIYGNRDGSPMQMVIGSRIEIPAWGATAPGDFVDSVTYIHMPLASNDSIIRQRLGGHFADTLIGHWDDMVFHTPNSNCPDSGWTNQSMEAFAFVGDPRSPEYFFWTNGDTLPMCTYIMETRFDTIFAGQILSPFAGGWYPQDHDLGLLWGFVNGNDWVAPVTIYPTLRFLTSSESGYIHGRVTNEYSNPLVGVSVTAEGTLRVDTTDSDGRYALDWFMPGAYNLTFAKTGYFDTTLINIETTAGDTSIADVTLISSVLCSYVPGDINGDGVANGLDIVFGVGYFKNGPQHPMICDCPPHGPLMVAGDVNGSCAFNGIDITYFVSYLKGGQALGYCPDCPPEG